MRRIAFVLIAILVASCQAPSPPQQASARPSALHQFVLFFRDGGAALNGDGQAIVARIVAEAHALHPRRIEVIGRNDGIAPNREKLAVQRAAAVAKALAKAGIDPAIIKQAGGVDLRDSGVAAHRVMVRFSPDAG